MRELALVPIEEWEKVKSLSNQREMKKITVPKIERENHQQISLKNMKKKESKMDTPLQPPQHPPPPPPPTSPVTAVEEKKKKKKKSKKKPMEVQNGDNLPPSNETVQPLLRIEHFAPSYRKDAAKILKMLRKSKKIAYNNKFEIIIKKKVIPNSNIVMLVQHALNKNNQSKLPGMTRFYQVLKKAHVPVSMVKNPLGQIVMNKKNAMTDN